MKKEYSKPEKYSKIWKACQESDVMKINDVKRQFAADCGIVGGNIKIGEAPSVEKGFFSDESYGAAVRDALFRRTGIQPRIYEGTSPFFRAIIMGNEYWIMADRRITGWCEKEYLNRKNGLEWAGQFEELKRVNDMLRKYGHGILDCRISMLPGSGKTPDRICGMEIQFMDSSELLEIRDPYPFRHALCDSTLMPCAMAAAAIADGKIVGMAGATEDCETMWQIGVDVLPAWRGKGIGSGLVGVLKEKILEKGKIPFYSTSQTHIASMNTALKAGFLPAWTEIFAK